MKQNRHQKIAELVSRYEIETQEELAEKLKEAGFTVTQATISRDIRQMNLSKLPTGNGRQKYVILKKENELLSDKYIRVLRDGFVSMIWRRIFWSCGRFPEWRWQWRLRWMPFISGKWSAVSQAMIRL